MYRVFYGNERLVSIQKIGTIYLYWNGQHICKGLEDEKKTSWYARGSVINIV